MAGVTVHTLLKFPPIAPVLTLWQLRPALNSTLKLFSKTIMDNQQIFNFVVAIAAFLAVFVFNQTTRKIQKLEDDVSAMREQILKDYVQKDDYKADIKEIKDILRQIFDKLDSKQDK